MQIPEQKKDIYHRLEYGRVDSLLVGSRLLKQNAVDNLPIAEQKVMVQPYGIDFSRFDPQITPTGFLRDLPDVAPDSLLIGVISRLEPLKGQMEIIDAMPKILAHHPAAILVLAGDETPELTGKYLPELEARVTKLGLEHKVIFTGYADDTAKVLRDLDVYVLPSHSETFSLGCLEAMAMGRAVVGTEAGGTPEMLGNGELGLLAEPKNPTSLAEKVCLLLDDATLRQKLGSRARTSVLKRHDQKLVIDRLLAFYRGNGHRADIHD